MASERGRDNLDGYSIENAVRRFLGPEEGSEVVIKITPISSEKEKNSPDFFQKKPDSLRGRLRFILQQKTLTAMVASLIIMVAGDADLSFTIRSVDDIKHAAAIECPQPPEESIQKALGFLAARHILYYNPSEPDSDLQHRFNLAYGQGLIEADPTLESSLHTLDESRICNDFVKFKVNKQTGRRRFIDGVAVGVGFAGIAIATGVLFWTSRSSRLKR